MLLKVEKNYYLDIMLGIFGVVSIITGIMLHLKPQFAITAIGIMKNIHIWGGYAFSVLTIFHLLWHFEWIKVMTQSITKAPKKMGLAILCAVVAVVILVGIALMAPAQKSPRGPSKMPAEKTVSYSFF